MSAWEDLDNDVLGLRQEVNAEAFAIAEAARVGGDTRSRKIIFAETARQLLMRRGVGFAGTVETIVAVNPEEETNLGAEPQVPRPGRSTEKRTAGEETPVEVAATTDGAVYPDDLCSPEDIPMNSGGWPSWFRLWCFRCAARTENGARRSTNTPS